MTRVALLGAGDLGRLLARHLEGYLDLAAAAFFDDVVKEDAVEGVPRLGGLDDVPAAYRDGAFDSLLMGIGYKHLEARAAIFDRFRVAGIPFATLIHPSCVLAEGATVGEGAVLFPGCILDVGAEVGVNSLLNCGCTVSHDGRVRQHSFLGPGVTLAGFVDVGSFCFIGVGTVVSGNVKLHDGCQTGAGAVVVDDVAAGQLVAGVPARFLRSVKR